MAIFGLTIILIRDIIRLLPDDWLGCFECPGYGGGSLNCDMLVWNSWYSSSGLFKLLLVRSEKEGKNYAKISTVKMDQMSNSFLLLAMQTVWTQIRPERMSVLIWIQTIWHSDSVSERIFLKNVYFEKSADDNKAWIWIQTIWHSDSVSERFFWKCLFWKSQQRITKSWKITWRLQKLKLTQPI